MSFPEIPGYRISETIGKGGMGVVYKATHLALDRVVAIKVLPPHLAEDDEFVASFAQEAKTIAKLEHPNVVAVYDFGCHDRSYYLVMQFVEGRTLRDLLIQRTPSIEESTGVLKQVAGALDYAHSREVVHRDVKPSNIMLCPNGKAMIMDFGVACGSHAGDLSGIWTAVGTPNYMAPEQCKGRKASPRSDQYSLGVVAYEMIAGRLPFKGTTSADVMHQHLTAPPPSLRKIRPEINDAVDSAVSRALSKVPEMRFESTTAFVRALEDASRQAATVLTPPSYSAGSRAPQPSGPMPLTTPASEIPQAAPLIGGLPTAPPPVRSTVYTPMHSKRATTSRNSSGAWVWVLSILIVAAVAIAAAVVYPRIAAPPAGDEPHSPVDPGAARKLRPKAHRGALRPRKPGPLLANLTVASPAASLTASSSTTGDMPPAASASIAGADALGAATSPADGPESRTGLDPGEAAGSTSPAPEVSSYE